MDQFIVCDEQSITGSEGGRYPLLFSTLGGESRRRAVSLREKHESECRVGFGYTSGFSRAED